MTEDWAIRLGGNDWSLLGLAAWFTQEQCKVSLGEDARYYLTSPDLIACGTEDERWKLAERIVGRINSAAKVLEPGHTPVQIDALMRTEPDGTRRSFARVSVGAHALIGDRHSAQVFRAGEVVEPSGPSLAERIVRLQEREGSTGPVARALEQWDLPEQNPTSLNNILEIIRDDVSGSDADRRRAWATMVRLLARRTGMQEAELDSEMRRCRNSLQSQEAIGSRARHGSPRKVANPMTLDDARDFVHRLLLAWLRSKI